MIWYCLILTKECFCHPSSVFLSSNRREIVNSKCCLSWRTLSPLLYIQVLCISSSAWHVVSHNAGSDPNWSSHLFLVWDRRCLSLPLLQVAVMSQKLTQEQKDELFQHSTLLLPCKRLVSQSLARSWLSKTCKWIPWLQHPNTTLNDKPNLTSPRSSRNFWSAFN